MKVVSFLTALSLSALSVSSVLAHNHHHHMVDHSADFKQAVTADQVRVDQCWVRLLPSHIPSAGYFVIQNDQDQPLELLAGSTPSFSEVMLHETIEEDGMAKMVMADKITVPAKGSLVFKPGGLHAMYEKPTHDIKVGDTMTMTLLFANQQKVEASCKVNPANARQYD